jgi:hypothetical protein
MTSDTSTANPLEGYLPDAELAKVRGVKERALRAERQRGDGPPFVKMGKQVLYPIEGFREWLKARERHPVRSTRMANQASA